MKDPARPPAFVLADARRSPFARLAPVDLNAVAWTTGFWAERARQVAEVTVPHLFQLGQNPEVGTAVRNLRIAAGLEPGEYRGNDWYDEWVHKWIEAAATVWARTRDPRLDAQMDSWIDAVCRAQCADGYLATQVQVRREPRYADPRRHECYVMGHFLTAACIHHRATGKTRYLEAAIKCGRHLHGRFTVHRAAMLHFPLNPSLVMGAVELYRTTGIGEFLELAQIIVDLRGAAGRDRRNPHALGDQNQDRVPLVDEQEVVGHSVFWSYLYAGAADVYLESGDPQVLGALQRLWDDVVRGKMYVTGGCGAVDIGKSMRSDSRLGKRTLLDSNYFDRSIYWDRDDVHEAVGAAHQLPNASAYNETCGQIGFHLWSWRMLLATGEPKYAEIMERQMYNGFLSGIGLDGLTFSYSNALRSHGRWHVRRVQPVTQRFPMAMEMKSCCPTNLVRTLAQIHGYLYTLGAGELGVHHYGANRLDAGGLRVLQETDYPWSGEIVFRFEAVGPDELTLRLRIPEWAAGASVRVNEAIIEPAATASTYVSVRRRWQPGDRVQLDLPLRVRTLAAHPAVEETRNQVALMRGPVVYCLEEPDLPAGCRVSDIALPAGTDFQPVMMEDALGRYVALAGTGVCHRSEFGAELYREIEPVPRVERVPVRLIPYFAWCNRGVSEMSVWLPKA